MANNRQVTFLINAQTKAFRDGLKSAQSTFKKIGRNMERTGRKLTRNVSAPLAAMGGLAVKAAGDFEDSFADIRKTVDTTEQQFASISQGMRDMAKTVPTSVEELNRMGGVAGQLGIEAENIVEFTETLAKLGDTTDIAGEQAALSLSRFMNIMGTSEDKIENLGSTIAGLGNNFAAMESEIVEIATSMAPLGNSIGLTEQQVLAFSGTIAASGGQARAASTAFQKTANTMKQAVIEGTDELEVFAETAGVSAEGFRKAFQEDAGEALTLFLEGLRRVQQEGGSVATVLDKVGLADQRLVREFGKVLGNLDDLNRALPAANTYWEENTALTEEAQKRYETFNSRVQILWNNLKDLGITIGNALMPSVDNLIAAAQKAIDYVSSLSKETIAMNVAITAAAAAIPPLIWALGSLIKMLAAVFSPMTAVIALFASTVVIGQNVVDNWSIIVAKWESKWIALEQAATLALMGIIKAIRSFVNFATTIAPPELITDIFGWDLSEMAMDVAGVSEILDSLNENLEDNEKRMADAIVEMNKPWASLTDSAKNALRLTKNAIISGLKGILNSDQIQGLIDQINDAISVNTQSESEGESDSPISAPTPTIGGGFQQTVDKVVDGVSRMRKATSDFKTATAAALTDTRDLWEKFADGAERVMDNLSQRLKDMMAQMFGDMATTLGAEVGKAIAGVEDSFTTSFEQIILIFLDFAKQLATLIGAIGGAMMFMPGMQGAGAAMLAAAATLSGVAAGFSAGIRKRAENRRQRSQDETSVNDALIQSDGSIVKFNPNDNILAMQDFSNLIPDMSMPATPSPTPAMAGGGKQIIEVPVYLDGREIYRNQKEVNRKLNR